MNSNELSRQLDSKAGLENSVRLSLCSNHPMMHIAKQEGRISNPVVLGIDLDVLLRPGVLFSHCNATRRDTVLSDRPDKIRFDVVQAESQFTVPRNLRIFYQAEVLIPGPVSPKLIFFPKVSGTSPPLRNTKK